MVDGARADLLVAQPDGRIQSATQVCRCEFTAFVMWESDPAEPGATDDDDCNPGAQWDRTDEAPWSPVRHEPTACGIPQPEPERLR